MRCSIICMLIASAALSPVLAKAADVPGGTNTKSTIKVSNKIQTGYFEFLNDSDWYRINLKKGLDYVFRIGTTSWNGYSTTVNLRDASGKILASGSDGTYVVEGFEFRPKKTGVYFVEYKVGGTDFTIPAPYSILVSNDCRRDRSTLCSLAVGKTVSSSLNYAYDSDWYRINLTAGKFYEFKVEFDYNVPSSLAIRDNNSKIIIEEEERNVNGKAVISALFTPSANGIFYADVEPIDDFGGSYRISLSVSSVPPPPDVDPPPPPSLPPSP